MENNLDKYFKDNLHDRKFEMKEEYWLGAEKLLEAQERRRKRRGIFFPRMGICQVGALASGKTQEAVTCAAIACYHSNVAGWRRGRKPAQEQVLRFRNIARDAGKREA